ncbi:MAG: phosphoadenylyl-sulfate reductase [Marinoscillum sp.]
MKSPSLTDINDQYTNLTYLDRLKLLFKEFDPGKILVTTSFGNSSVVLLHMINKVQPRHPIHLINTGYLFTETLEYKELLINQYDLNIVDVRPNLQKHQVTKDHRLWESNSDLCCQINKVDPMSSLKSGKDVWVSGVLRFQNANRADMRIFEEKADILNFHPIIDMSQEDLNLYRTIYELPAHPLSFRGYGSIGCVQCTKKGVGRTGRWEGEQKTECGLHL